MSQRARPSLGLGAIIRENHLLALLLEWWCRGSGPDPPPRGIGVQHAGTALPPGVWDIRDEGRHKMAAMKPRTGDGPLEVTKEGRGIVMRVPLEGGGRLVVEMTKDEANDLSEALKGATG
jgi:hypothetical protein